MKEQTDTSQFPECVMPDDWLGAQLDRRAARVHVPDDVGLFIDIIKKLQSEVVFLYSKVSCLDVKRVNILGRLGFYLVDTNLTFSRPVSVDAPLHSHAMIRWANPEDEAEVVAIAEEALLINRWYLDENIPKNSARRIEREWVRNFFRGERGTHMAVAELEGRIVGFNQLIKTESSLIIDEFAVSERARGMRIGADLITYAESQFDGSLDYIVGTQAGNISAVRLYEKMKFRLKSSEYVFHFHGHREVEQ